MQGKLLHLSRKPRKVAAGVVLRVVLGAGPASGGWGGPGGVHAGAISGVFDYALTSSALSCLVALYSGSTHGRHMWP